ncbi:MAG: DUF3048 domain-containing protein [Lachnospiraceae bacterium]|nr:DUF3048 domain-containing protein [Lachnospiraceae bacterium]
MKKNLVTLLGLSLTFTVLFTGCGSKPEEKVEQELPVIQTTDAAIETEQEEAKEPEVYSGPRSILTGEPISNKLSKVRPIALMVENTSACLPHYGINKAGVIYECPVEGGITRLMAIFEDYKGMDRIGNVRSCRPYYPKIAKEYGAVYMCFGQSTEGKALLQSGFIDYVNGIEGASYNASYYRSSDRRAPHNAYTSSKGIEAGLKLKNYKSKRSKKYEQHFKFTTEDKPVTFEGKKDCEVVTLYYPDNDPYFVYNKKTGLYQRFEHGGKETDALDNKQIKVKNIILQNVPCTNYSGTYKLNLTLNGSGEGKYITNGKVVSITWEKKSDNDITKYYDKKGNELVLNPGKTWVSLIEENRASGNQFYKNRKDFNR